MNIVTLGLVTQEAVTFEVGGKTYTCSPLRIRHLSECFTVARAEALKAWRLENGGAKAGDKSKLGEMNAILFGRMIEDLSVILAIYPVRAKLLELSLKPKHPDITIAQIDDLLDNLDASNELIGLILDVSFGIARTDEGGSENNPNPLLSQTTESS